jgi:LysR family transcriptional regulator, hypochlorite-specific transcription factor HypT
MDLEWIADFLELAATKNFTIASKNRNRSQPAFSRRILGLEQWVGASLIDRSVHPFTLTQEGEHFRQAAQEIINSIHRTLDECRQHQRINQHFIKFTALHTLAINYFAEWIADINRNFTSICSTMNANNVHDCVESLQSKQSEFMLSYSTPTIPSLLNPADFLACKLKRDELILVSAPDKDNKPLFKINSKKPINYLAYVPNCLMGKMTDKIISTQCETLELKCVYENAIAESIKAMAIQGMGVAWLPRICIQAELDRGDLINIGNENLTMPLDIMLYRSSQRLSNEGESLWAYLNKHK